MPQHIFLTTQEGGRGHSHAKMLGVHGALNETCQTNHVVHAKICGLHKLPCPA
jgi:hypothetical protein